MSYVMVRFADTWAKSLTPASGNAEPVNPSFLYSGTTIETVATVGGFVEGVAVLVLAL